MILKWEWDHPVGTPLIPSAHGFLFPELQPEFVSESPWYWTPNVLVCLWAVFWNNCNVALHTTRSNTHITTLSFCVECSFTECTHYVNLSRCALLTSCFTNVQTQHCCELGDYGSISHVHANTQGFKWGFRLEMNMVVNIDIKGKEIGIERDIGRLLFLTLCKLKGPLVILCKLMFKSLEFVGFLFLK